MAGTTGARQSGNAMSTLTKEQWKQIEQQLSGPFGRVELKADGYALALKVEGAGPLKQCIMVYVNGWVRGEWVKGGCPEADKFCRIKRSHVWSAKHRARAEQELKKRRLDACLRDHYERVAGSVVTAWLPYWTSPASLARHLRKTCADVEIVELGYRG